ncbi:tRNA lysidine(34) synthetase TilS [Terrimonas ferruginea]|uniref:tRNA lysidine(34) synthetase TilS n=1 Tax=Terrimonas ferruginea TaxID=249 RepID=UPI000405A827|nr:tRNA lysidine(34) synthetase TilS [Terrimonas ferruginea]
MDLITQFKNYIKQHDLFTQKDKLLLALSGGLDSVVLCELCHRCDFDVEVLHMNFQLREAESERDAAFVEKLAQQYTWPFHLKKTQAAAESERLRKGIQETARLLRYDWFEACRVDIATASGKRTWVLTAHHLDDNIETSVMHFFRGTGIAGLRGMLPVQGNVVRPLLFASRQQLQQFAKEQQLTWVEDSSNLLETYARNYVRHSLLTTAERIYPDLQNRLAGNLARFAETEALYKQAIAWHRKQLVEQKGNEMHLPVLKLKKTIPLQSVLYELLQPYGFQATQLPDVMSLLDAETGRFVASATHRILRNRAWLVVSPTDTIDAVTILIDGPGLYTFPGGELQLTEREYRKEEGLETDATTAILDARKISFPLLLRKWKTADYFYPLGMRKKKKIARFLIDQKKSKIDKEKIWVLEAQHRICWVVGHRIDDRFRVLPATSKVLGLKWKPA